MYLGGASLIFLLLPHLIPMPDNLVSITVAVAILGIGFAIRGREGPHESLSSREMRM